jgi:glycerophosphoryl diester phosphodiesterase
MRPPLVIAHRGDSAHRPENTLASFAGALEVGATVIELDVQLTADGELVVIHDSQLGRTTTGTGDVRQMRLAEVRAVSAGYAARFGDAWKHERVPTLVEALTLLQGRAGVLIEIKAESVADDEQGGVEARAVALVRRLGMTEKVGFVSLEPRALIRLGRLAPEAIRGQLFGRTSADEVLHSARETGCNLVIPHKSQLDDAFAARIHGAGLTLATWMVDVPDELKELARFGLYGVGSNCPGVLIEAIANGLLDG